VRQRPVVVLAPPVDRAAVLRCLDYPPGREPPARVAALLDDVLVEARALVQARGAWLALAPARAGGVGLVPIEAQGLAVGLVTLGPALEARVAALQAAGSLTRALLLDACGSAAAEEAADLLSARVLEGLGLTAPSGAPAGTPGCRLSPGYGGWSLEHQPALLGLLDASALGVSLTPGLMMQPRKSISFAMWLGAAQRPAEGLAGCRACGLRRCRYAGG
jgi:hypothetical protein